MAMQYLANICTVFIHISLNLRNTDAPAPSMLLYCYRPTMQHEILYISSVELLCELCSGKQGVELCQIFLQLASILALTISGQMSQGELLVAKVEA